MMFYSDEDLDFYEHEIDLTALKKRQEEQAKKEEQERASAGRAAQERGAPDQAAHLGTPPDGACRRPGGIGHVGGKL